MPTKKYPVGARWEYASPEIGRAAVWLDHRHETGREVWKWTACYPDGSHAGGDWRPTRQGAVDEAMLHLCHVTAAFRGRTPGRFRRTV